MFSNLTSALWKHFRADKNHSKNEAGHVEALGELGLLNFRVDCVQIKFWNTFMKHVST